jgi:O-antigen/teichoic acid export membrane protein
MLTYFNDLAAVAIFGVAFARTVMPALRVIFTPLNGVQMPMFARIRAEDNPVKQAEAYETLSRFLCLWLIPAAVALAVLARPLITLVFQARYVDAAATASVLAIFLFAESLFSPAQIVLLVNDRYRAVLTSRALALISIPLLFLAIPFLGSVGAAFAIGIARVSAQLLSTFIAGRDYHLHFPASFFARMVLISLGMGAVMLIPLNLIGSATPFDSILKLVLSFALGGVTFLALFKLLGGLEDRDKQRILTLPIPFKKTVVNWL